MEDGAAAAVPGLGSAEEVEEARRIAEIAARAEARAAERAAARLSAAASSSAAASLALPPPPPQTAFLTKQQREQQALERLEARRKEVEERAREAAEAQQRFLSGQAQEERKRAARLQQEELQRKEQERRRAEQGKAGADDVVKVVPKTAAEKLKKVFQMDWDATEDTSRSDSNSLYKNRLQINPLFGRGFVAGVDHVQQREKSTFFSSLSQRRGGAPASAGVGAPLPPALVGKGDASKLPTHWSEKPLENMTERDWRIFREDFDIRIQHGRAVNPLRSWAEANLPDAVMRAVRQLGYKEPSPIQRQAIPIGLAMRDVIGIAETGSGKTAAFIIPLLCHLLRLPASFAQRVAEEGPLAIVMAPTRELAQQIEEECIKLAVHTGFRSACIVGGQAVEDQSIKLRQGVHIVIGTPGRMEDLIASNFLVLNQCNYVVLDEADRMIDMGFEGQVTAVLDAMGGLLKSEDEEALEQQVASALSAAAEQATHFRVTAMFSATMPPEVERMAKTYLRHPAVIKIGDQDSGKNKRIEQRVVFISEGQKKGRIVEELRRLSFREDKAIVFVNAKKQCDVVGRFLEGAGLSVGILHGGKSQDQREETLDLFRRGDFRILVATDVAGRGLDIANVTHVFNFDCPSKIENYCHRIGRTGRAGKSGVATTLLTDGDTEIMFDLRSYLESTGAAVPQQLARHPSAKNPGGAGGGEFGPMAGQKRGRD